MKKNIQLYLCILCLLLANILNAQNSGDYRSAGSGLWDAVSSWQYYNGSTWISPNSQGFPGKKAVANNITIQAGHTITANFSNTTYDIGGSSFYISGTLIVNANLNVSKNCPFIVQSGGSIIFSGTNIISRLSTGGGTGTPSFTLSANATLKTQHPLGINTNNTGSVQLGPASQTYSAQANYEYNGTDNQVIGKALPGSTPPNFFLGTLTISNTAGIVSLSQPLNMLMGGNCTIATGATLATSYSILNALSSLNVNGKLQLNAGGNLAQYSIPPNYSNTSTLIYNENAATTPGLEWNGNSTTAGSGIPQNVIIQNNTILNMPNSDLGLAGNLFINSGTLNLSTTNGNDLNVGGNWTRTNLGTFNPNSRTVFLNGSNPSSIIAPETTTRDTNGAFGGETFPYLTINKSSNSTTVKILSNMNITKTLTLTQGILDLDTSDLLFASNLNITADLAIVNTAKANIIYSGKGRCIVQRFIPNSGIRSWRFLTAPLQSSDPLTINNAWQEGRVNRNVLTPNLTNPWPGFGTQITGPGGVFDTTNGFDAGTHNQSIKSFDNSGPTNKWNYPTNTTLTTLMSQYAWAIFIRGDRGFVITNQYAPSKNTTLEPKGKINTGDQTLTVAAGKTNLLGNPFPCAINMANVNIGGAIHQQFKLWDPKAFYSYDSTGKYIPFTWANNAYTASNSPATTWTNPGTIESGEGFFVKPATSMVMFHETDKVSGLSTPNGIQTRPANNAVADNVVAFFRTNLAFYDETKSGYTKIDGTLNLYNSSYNTSVDPYEDTESPIGSSETGAIRILKENIQLAISKENSIQQNDTIFLSLAPLKQIQHQLWFTNIDFPNNLSATLIDKFSNTSMPIKISNSDTTVYNFNVTADPSSNASNRFMVVFRPQNSLPVKFVTVNASKQSNIILVQWNVENEIGTKYYIVEKSSDGILFKDVDTIKTINNNLSSKQYNWNDINVITGNNYYRIKSVDKDGSTSLSQITKVFEGSGSEEISIYPNPITNNIVKIHFTNQPTGNFQLKLFDLSGKLVFSKTIAGAGNYWSASIQLNNDLSTGIYHLQIINPEGISNTKKIEIQ